MGRVFVLGSLNVDLVTRVERHPRPGETLMGEGLARFAGGKGANQAVAARAAGADVVMLGAVGEDDGGAAYRRRLAALGIDAGPVSVEAGAVTGHAIITVDAAGENVIVVVPGANAAVSASHLSALDQAGPGDVLLASLEVPVAAVVAAVRRATGAGARVVLNLAPYAALPHDVVALADPVVVNEHEALALADAGQVPGSLLVTFGANGAAWDGIPAPAVGVPEGEVLDTTGAGDAFCGALAAALARGLGRDEALAAAMEAGAEAVRRHGAQPDPAL
ncbi:PfkB family carbohydrate kinase [Oryzihumus leptocrescens]|uniref:Ribokinase n=1 Tax=Oryzihumus leptocrescens TaxID=297536 RepID=A0A542ZFM7_9MICO|nr:PfkB family carbohydrate kinase [Oryzihumus leptocrescens]TQL59143.1 ribokinase [Oryzihumus leptocrescens]